MMTLTEIMTFNIPLPFYILLILAFGWLSTVILFIFLVLIHKFAPVRAYIKARFKKGCALFHLMFRDGTTSTMVGKNTGMGCSDVETLGPVATTEGSASFLSRFKVTQFFMFGEQSATISPEYPAILQELREKGFKISTFADYQTLVKLATDSAYADEQINKISDPEARKEFKESVNVLRTMKITLKPYKTYSFHGLSKMFPFNWSPAFLKSVIAAEVLRARNKDKWKLQMLVGAAIIIVILLIGVGVFIKMTGSTSCVCSCGEVVKEVVREAAANPFVTSLVMP